MPKKCVCFGWKTSLHLAEEMCDFTVKTTAFGMRIFRKLSTFFRLFFTRISHVPLLIACRAGQMAGFEEHAKSMNFSSRA